MAQGALDHQSAGDPLWREAERRERVIRPLAGRSRLTASEVADAATALGLGRSRIYEMVALYRATPLTSALIPPKPGPRRGARLLAPEAEAVIEQGIRGYYMTRRKPTVAGLRRYIEHECQGKSLPTPSIKSLRVQIDRQKRKALVKSRDGARAADNQFRPVVGQHVSEYALQVTRIDHTKVDVIVVDDLMRRPLGRPWLTLIIDLASRMVAGFHLTMEAPSSDSKLNGAAITIAKLKRMSFGGRLSLRRLPSQRRLNPAQRLVKSGDRRREIHLRRWQRKRPSRRDHKIRRRQRRALRIVRVLVQPRRRRWAPRRRPAQLTAKTREVGQGVELMAAATSDLEGHLKPGETGEHPARAGARYAEGPAQCCGAEQRRRGQEIDGVGQPGATPQRRLG